MKTKRIEIDKTDSQSKLKVYEKKKEKCIEVFAFQNQKIIDDNNYFFIDLLFLIYNFNI